VIRRTFSGAAIGSLAALLCGTPGLRALAGVVAERKPVVGRLSEGALDARKEVFRAAMRRLGHPEVVLDIRPAHGDMTRLPELAKQLVDANVDVIWTTGSYATQIAKDATRTIPIVMVSADALAGGLVDSLARPGGNVTGLTLVGTELVRKRLELLTRVRPRIRRIVALSLGPGSETVPFVVNWKRESQQAAAALGVAFEFIELPMREPMRWDSRLAEIARTPGSALAVMESPFFLGERKLLAELALKHRLPTVFAFRAHVDDGGLFAYGFDFDYIDERVAYYIARILGGTQPSDLPVEQPTKYELVINTATARSLGLSLPRALLLQADRVIP
jgi:ABC-type uncharacterized transport system substrate-binding protein